MATRKTSPVMLRMMRAAELLHLDTAALSDFVPVYRIGQGARSLHYFAMATQADGYPGNVLQQDKRATLEILRRAGLPTTRAVGVNDHGEAGEAARRLGFPCTVKPVWSGKGIGVTAGIFTAPMLRQAVEHASRRRGFPVIVENHVEGDDHRLLVVDGQLLWVYRRRAPFVVGDGNATMAELIARENARREQAPPAHQDYLQRLRADSSMLLFLRERYRFDLDSIPRSDQRVKLADVANLARGGTLKDVTTRLHPENRELAVDAARALRLGNLGIDFITTDIGRSWRELPSAIIEVNTTPGISGIGDASLALRTAFPGRLSGRIPAFLVVGEGSYRDEVAGELLARLSDANLHAGFADHSDGEGTFDRVQRLLDDTSVEAIVVSCSPEAIRKLGLPLRRCDVLITANAALRDLCPAEQTIVGDASRDALRQVAAAATASYASGCPGGARPVLEWLPSVSEAADHLVLRIWRIRALPSAWFWSRVPEKAQPGAGMIGPYDLLAATVRVADAHLARQGQPRTGMRIDGRELDGAWAAPYLDVRLPLKRARAGEVEAALRSATDLVNGLVAQPAPSARPPDR